MSWTGLLRRSFLKRKNSGWLTRTSCILSVYVREINLVHLFSQCTESFLVLHHVTPHRSMTELFSCWLIMFVSVFWCWLVSSDRAEQQACHLSTEQIKLGILGLWSSSPKTHCQWHQTNSVPCSLRFHKMLKATNINLPNKKGNFARYDIGIAFVLQLIGILKYKR